MDGAKKGRRKAIKETARLSRLIDEAIVDCKTQSEATLGFFTMIENDLELPFTTQVLGMDVTAESVHLTDADEIVVSCRRGRFRQALPILHVPLPKPAPKGAEWIEAYRHWVRGR